MGPERYNSYGEWLKLRFGETVYKVSVDGGFTCPNRDGTLARGGCTYCSNDSFRALGVGAGKPVEQQIEEGIRFLSSRFGARKFIVYWQHYTNTHSDVETLQSRFRQSLYADDRDRRHLHRNQGRLRGTAQTGDDPGAGEGKVRLPGIRAGIGAGRNSGEDQPRPQFRLLR